MHQKTMFESIIEESLKTFRVNALDNSIFLYYGEECHIICVHFEILLPGWMKTSFSCHLITFATVHAADADVRFCDGPGMLMSKIAWQLYNSIWTAFLKRGYYMGRVKRSWYLSPMPAAKVQESLRIRAVSPEPRLLAHTSSESRGTFRQKARFLAHLNGWACAVKICHDGMLEDTNSLDAPHMIAHGHSFSFLCNNYPYIWFFENWMVIIWYSLRTEWL